MQTHKDMRRKARYEKQQKRFKNHQPRTKKDRGKGYRKAQQHIELIGLVRHHSKTQLKQLAEETVKIIKDGTYVTEDGEEYDIQKLVEDSVSGTITYNPVQIKEIAEEIITNSIAQYDTNFEVELETTLDGVQRAIELFPKKSKIAALNFASAKNPGGGFLRGTFAQEESIAYSSGLYECIQNSLMYEKNREDNLDCLYHHHMIFSPGVPVIRDNDGDFIKPYTTSFLTVPAVNAGEARAKRVPDQTIINTMRERMDYLLAMALKHKTDVLILGSWGCGVFGGNINVVAKMFIEFLTTKYEGQFKYVIFSTLDPNHKEIFEYELDQAF